MVLLVCSGNLFNLLLGWECIGITSFLLINFWTVKIGALKSAFKAFSFNKISDLFLVFGIVLLINIFHTADIITICNSLYIYINIKFLILNLEISYLYIVAIFFFVLLV